MNKVNLMFWVAVAMAAFSGPGALQAEDSSNSVDPTARAVLLKPPVELLSDTRSGHPLTSRLIVKFRDDLLVRSEAGSAVSLVGKDLSPIQEVAAELGLSFSPLIRLPEQKLLDLQARAAELSGVAQPDLGGMMIVSLEVENAPAIVAAGQALGALDEVEFVHRQVLGVPPPADIPPWTPEHVGLQTYRGPDPGMNADYAWSLGITGEGIRLSDCEYGWVASHEDLEDIDIHPEPGQTIDPGVISNGWDEHGTAVLGETSGVVNEYGVSGMVPDADVYTYPEWTVEEGFRRVTAITNAIANSAAGDVVLLEMQTTGAGGGYGPAELNPAVWTVVKTGTDAGVIVVGAAGNGNQDLDSDAYEEYRGRGDSGAIIVGAGSADELHDKLSFSTHGSRVDVHGWGEAVFTLGYGYFAEYGGDKNQRYTSTFSGTSSASPFVASAAVAVQQAVVDGTGEPLSPEALRSLLMETGIPQGSGDPIGPFVNLQAALDAVALGPLTVSVDIRPGTDPNPINPRSRGLIPVAILTTSDFDATEVDPLTVAFGPDGVGIAHWKSHVADVDFDGDLDLLLHFRTRLTGIACGDTEAFLTGAAFAGELIEGSDSIHTVGCW